MIGIDTNILIRYFVGDDKKQSNKASLYLEENCTIKNPGFITSIVLCEVVWVLESAYGYDKENILLLLKKLLTTSELLIENQDSALKALRVYEKGTADFSDYYIANIAKNYKAEKTITFDKKAGKYELFELL